MEAEHVGWFQPGSISLSFVCFAIAAVVVVCIVGGLVRYLQRRNLAHAGSHH